MCGHVRVISLRAKSGARSAAARAETRPLRLGRQSSVGRLKGVGMRWPGQAERTGSPVRTQLLGWLDSLVAERELSARSAEDDSPRKRNKKGKP